MTDQKNKHGQPLTIEEKNEIRKLFLTEGLSVYRISKITNRSPHCITVFVKKDDLKNKRQELAQKVKEGLIKKSSNKLLSGLTSSVSVAHDLVKIFQKSIIKHTEEDDLTTYVVGAEFKSLLEAYKTASKTLKDNAQLIADAQRINIEARNSDMPSEGNGVTVVWGDETKPGLVEEPWFNVDTAIHQIEAVIEPKEEAMDNATVEMLDILERDEEEN